MSLTVWSILGIFGYYDGHGGNDDPDLDGHYGHNDCNDYDGKVKLRVS